MKRQHERQASSYSVKAPFTYSNYYHNWAASLPGSDDDRLRADRAFRRAFHVPLCWKDGRPIFVG